MKKTLAIIGCGHLGQQIAHYAVSDGHYQNVVFFDDFSEEKNKNGFEILGNCDAIEYEFRNNSFDEIIIGIGYKHLEKRKFFFERYEDRIPFGTILHSSCWIDQSAIVKKGSVVYPFCCIDAHAVIGENTVLNISCSIAHDTIVGNHCFLSPSIAVAGFVKIEDQCIIGINTTVIDNITIKSKTQIGAGTVVIDNIEKVGLYVGNPQRFIRNLY
jgi:sugar O-acyltransferase (sialic acid O-acetyltransferase NeuD family)